MILNVGGMFFCRMMEDFTEKAMKNQVGYLVDTKYYKNIVEKRKKLGLRRTELNAFKDKIRGLEWLPKDAKAVGWKGTSRIKRNFRGRANW